MYSYKTRPHSQDDWPNQAGLAIVQARTAKHQILTLIFISDGVNGC